MKEPDNGLVSLTVQKEITELFKDFLQILETLQFDNNLMVDKLSKVCDEETVKFINYFTPEKYEQIRKQVLDRGNSCSRKILGLLEFYDFYINKQKIEDAISQRKIVKKYTSTSPISIE